MSPQEEKKKKMLERVAGENGVAIVVLDEDAHEVSVSNNNSICRALTASSEFAPRCAEYCGVAFRNTVSGSIFEYECYVGLHCKAIPVADRGQRFVAIVGRTFTKADKYRKATERAISGDLARFPQSEIFENVLISGSELVIERAANELSKYKVAPGEDVLELKPSRPEKAKPAKVKPAAEVAKPTPAEAAKKGSVEVAKTPEADKISKRIDKFKAASQDKKKAPAQPARRRTEAVTLRTLYGTLHSRGFHTKTLVSPHWTL
jgi:hypothetical protein